MQFTDRGIVLGITPTRDKGLILRLLSEEWGIKVYFISGLGNKKKGKHRAYLYPGALLEVSGVHRKTSTLAQVTQYHPDLLLPQTRFSVVKSSVALFCTEVIHALVPEEYHNPVVFTVCKQALLTIEANDSPEIPIWFLCSLGTALGWLPNALPHRYFDIRNSQFQANPPQHPDYFGDADSDLFALTLNYSPEKFNALGLHRSQRKDALNLWIRYLGVKKETPLRLRCLDVFQTIFH